MTQKRFPSEQKNSKALGQEIGSLSEDHPYIGLKLNESRPDRVT